MKKLSLKRGFTLIELLVVIAIIGILASVVLASLNSARSKGADVAVKADLANVTGQMDIYYDDNASSYGTATSTNGCTITTSPLKVVGTAATAFSNTVVQNALTHALTNSGDTTASGITCSIDSTGQKYAIWISLLKSEASTATPKGWCVDNSGFKGKATALTVTAGVCTP